MTLVLIAFCIVFVIIAVVAIGVTTERAALIPDIFNRIMADTKAGKVKWSCGAHSDFWSGIGPGYVLNQTDDRMFALDFQFCANGTSMGITIDTLSWQKLVKMMRTPPETIASNRDKIETFLRENP